MVCCVVCCSVLQPSKVACIEYPRDAGKDEQYPWVCLWKAVWVADNTLGARAKVSAVPQAAVLPISSDQSCLLLCFGAQGRHKLQVATAAPWCHAVHVY